MEVVVALLFCRHLTFELVVDWTRAGLEKTKVVVIVVVVVVVVVKGGF